MTAEMRDLVARREAARVAESTAVLRSLIAPAADADWPAVRRGIADRQDQIRQATQPHTTPEEGK